LDIGWVTLAKGLWNSSVVRPADHLGRARLCPNSDQTRHRCSS